MTPAALDTVFASVAGPSHVGWAAVQATDDTLALMPGEEQAIARAVPKRIAEFTGGRVAARIAMQRLGVAPLSVPMGPDRAPIWPNGMVGSITHTQNTCAAMVACTSTHKMLGLDVEEDLPLQADLVPEIASHSELAFLAQTDPAIAARRIFSAKEAVYKAIYPHFGKVVGFSAMQITFQSDTQGIATPLGPLAEWSPAPLAFHQISAAGLILTYCAISQ